MALEFLKLRYSVQNMPECWKGKENEYGRNLYFTLNSLDIFVKKNRLVIENDEGIEEEDGENGQDPYQNTEDRIIYLLYRIADNCKTMDQNIYQEWRQLIHELTLLFEL